MVRSMIPFGTTLPRPFDTFRREVDSLFDRFWGSDGGWTAPMIWEPRTDLAETEDAYEICVELPGLKPEDFNVELKQGELWVTGERRDEEHQEGKTYQYVERRYGSFRRVIPLPNTVDADHVHADYKDGVLMISVPKAESSKPRRIEVKAQ